MKKLKLVSTFILMFFIGMSIVYASPSAGLSVNRSTIEVGQSVTVTLTLTNTAAWNIRVDSAGSTSGCSIREVGDSGNGFNTTKTFRATCTATSIGIISFTLSGDATSEDLSNKNVSGSVSVTVKAATPTTTRSADNKLSELSIEGFSLIPEFAASVTNYNVEVEQGATSVKINARAANSSARIAGTGEIPVKEGENLLEVVVTAANGSTKTYTINVFVPEKDPIEMNFNGETLSILRKIPEERPLHFELTTTVINEEEIETLYNELLDMTLVYVRNVDGECSYYIFKDGEIKEAYKTIESDSTLIIISDITEVLKDMTLVDLNINGHTIKVMQARVNNQFYIVKGTNILTGENNFYYYDHLNSTLSLFDEEGYNITSDLLNNNMMYITYGLAAGIAILLLVIIFMSSEKRKIRKLVDVMKEKTMSIDPIKEEETPIEKEEAKSNRKKKNQKELK